MLQTNLWNNEKILRRSALFRDAYGTVALASIGRAQDQPSMAGIHDAMQGFVDRKKIAGAVTMMVDKERVLLTQLPSTYGR